MQCVVRGVILALASARCLSLSAPAPPGGGGPFNSHWFSNRNATKLSASGDVLLWDAIQKPDTIVTYLPAPFSLASDGDKAEIKMAWESDGDDSCPSSDWANHGFCKDKEPCLHTSIHCLAGTGDFRIGFLDSNGAGQVNGSGWAETTSYSGLNKALEKPPFSGYLGYSIRIQPHVSSKAEHYVPKSSGSTAVPCSFNWNGLKHPGSALSKERLAYHGCYEAPAGKWTDFQFTIERVSSKEAKLSMSMNGVSYKYTHKMSSAEKVKFPKQIDTILIEYPNSRHYSYVKLAPYGFTPPPTEAIV